MAAPALDVDRDAVKALAIQIGIRPAAREFGLNEETVKSWAVREQWFPKPALAVLPPTMKPIATNAPKASVATANAMQSLGDKSKLKLSKATAKAATKLASMPGEAILSRTNALKDLASTGKILHDWGQSEQASLVIHLGSTAQPCPVTADPLDMLKSCHPQEQSQSAQA